jgi:hypothetical protein
MASLVTALFNQPPGCVFDHAMAKITEEFITSFVRNDDMGKFCSTFGRVSQFPMSSHRFVPLVPRISYHNVGEIVFTKCHGLISNSDSNRRSPTSNRQSFSRY